MNFGYIQQIIKEKLIENYGKKEFNTILKEYIEMIKSYPILQEQFFLYKNLQTTVLAEQAKDYVQDNINLIKSKYTVNAIKESEERMLTFLLEHFDYNQPDSKQEVFENIDYLVKNTKNLTNVMEFNNRMNSLTGLLSESIEAEEEVPEEATEEEINMISELYGLSDEDQKNKLKAIKESCLSKTNHLLSEAKDDLELKEKLLQVKENILAEEYKKETFILDFINLNELRKNLD